MESDNIIASDVVVIGYSVNEKRISKKERIKNELQNIESLPEVNREEYDKQDENSFVETLKKPLSTFSVDVDAASYSNMRRFINLGKLPPPEAVRIEEMLNYFKYNYNQPTDKAFSVLSELSECPWNEKNYLLRLGLQTKKIPVESLPPSNLVFLIDVSGSMEDANKLPLLISAFSLLTEELRPDDRVGIVVYAGAAGVVLKPTSGKDKKAINEALSQLRAGGSTAGAEGIELAYKLAKENFLKKGNNRVILATDGDFNVGISSEAALQNFIESKRNEGIFLTVLGFGTGNIKDNIMETLADKGNGNYAYIDNISEAQKVLINEFGGTLFAVAKDVKIQIEFNPAHVKSYRLIGYENRKLNDEDFNDDKKDAGEVGTGHSVTALYEIIPNQLNDEKTNLVNADTLKYSQLLLKNAAEKMPELLTFKLRYKEPEGDKSALIEFVVLKNVMKFEQTTDDHRFTAAVAAFGQWLKKSPFLNNMRYKNIYSIAKNSCGKDEEGYRSEFTRLVKSAEKLKTYTLEALEIDD
jgi:Ca-activated chloride channel family protein